MKLLVLVALSMALSAAKAATVARFVMWRDDETQKTYMTQVQKLGALHVATCEYQLAFCGQAVELEKVDKICAAAVHKSMSPAAKAQDHMGMQQMHFELAAATDEAPQRVYRVELNSKKSTFPITSSKIKTFEKSESGELKPAAFGTKAAFFELLANCK